jgi:uncharacterized protein YecT (DUF1311 family)
MKFHNFFLLILMAGALFGISANAASQDGRIDCKTASTPAQTSICLSDALSKLDRRTAVVFSGLLDTHKQSGGIDDSYSSAFALQKSQDEWRQSREKCGTDSVCLEKSMRARFNHLIGRRNPENRSKIDKFLGEYDYLESVGGISFTRISDKEVLFILRTGDDEGKGGVDMVGFVRMIGDKSGLYLQKDDKKPCALLVLNKAPYYLMEKTGLVGCATGKYAGMYKWVYR